VRDSLLVHQSSLSWTSVLGGGGDERSPKLASADEQPAAATRQKAERLARRSVIGPFPRFQGQKHFDFELSHSGGLAGCEFYPRDGRHDVRQALIGNWPDAALYSAQKAPQGGDDPVLRGRRGTATLRDRHAIQP